jgi:hypothetical protein
MKNLAKILIISFLALSISSCQTQEEVIEPTSQNRTVGQNNTNNVNISSLGDEAFLNTVPVEIMAYFRGVLANDANAVANAFSENGEIIDVSRSIRGRENIARWTSNEVLGGRYRLIEQTVLSNGDIRILLNFSTPPATSNGWRANYTFRIQNGKIVLADLQYA